MLNFHYLCTKIRCTNSPSRIRFENDLSSVAFWTLRQLKTRSHRVSLLVVLCIWCTNHVYCQSTPYKLYAIMDSVWEKENSLLYIRGNSRGETCNIFDTIRDLCSHCKVSPYRCWGINALCIYIIYETTM